MRFLSLLLFATTATVVPAQNLPAWSNFKVDVWNCVPPLSATSFGSRSWF
jgi:hypothetical protein